MCKSISEREMGMYERIKTEEEGGVCDGVGNADDLEIAAAKVPTPTSVSLCIVGRSVLAPEHRQKNDSRLVSLDVFRGLSVALMILVDDAGGLIPAINHSPWDGVTLADFVMPFFLFIVGVSLGLAYKKLEDRLVATRKALLRALKLFLLGLFLQGGYFHPLGNLTYGLDVGRIRVMGILQRIAVAYVLAALSEIWLTKHVAVKSKSSMATRYWSQWVMVICLSAIYMLLLYGLTVTDWEYQIPFEASSYQKLYKVKCGVRGDTGPACNVVGMIDRNLLGIHHLYKRPIYSRTKDCSINSPNYGPLPPNAPPWCLAPFDPEGLLSSVMAVVTCLVGLHFGHIIIHFKDHKDRTSHWVIASSCLLLVGLALSFLGMPVNKPLYTLSYMSVTAGAAGLLFTTIYLMVDVIGIRWATKVLEWMGKHALTIYVLAASNLLPIILQGFYWRYPGNNILSLIGIRKS
ncbi:hypothetical protein SAY86_017783 [Trapa natans]|uniref:Heparan-alpha-glucosaminide N-acetyltransferase n=1 Tax=Trapa natans TaxID=22666 RepID=A0AAN7LRV5_TRANT|nr:hypothetical protein SAY86_017783 [Trapa natans]